MVLTKDKHLKLYASRSCEIATKIVNALMVEIEHVSDATVLKLSAMEDGRVLILKTPSQFVCDEWKEKLNMIHYQEIDDIVDVDVGPVVLPTSAPSTEKLFRKRSKSIDRTTKNEPVLLSHSKTLPHMGRLKKRAKEQAGGGNNHPAAATKAKRLSYQRSEAQEQSKRGLSSFIRSFTVDTLQRKGKNKSFDFSADVIKETQHGFLTEIVSTKQSMTQVQRYCRISGKILYCHASREESRPLWKVALRNAIIEDNVEPDNLFRIKVTDSDSGTEYNFLLNSEDELKNWVEAMEGADKLHSPDITRTLPSPPQNNSSPLKSPLNKTSSESSPALPARLSTSAAMVGEDNLTYDCTGTPSPPLPRHRSQNQPSPPVPMRVQSRQSYKTTTSVDILPLPPLLSGDRIPLSGHPSGIDKRQLTHTLSNGEGAPPMSQTSPPVPRRMKNSKDNTKDVKACDTNNNAAVILEDSLDRQSVGKENAGDTLESDVVRRNLTEMGGSSSSLSSTNTTSTMSSVFTKSTALSENDLCVPSSPSKEERGGEDVAVLEEFMHEIRQDQQPANIYRWIVLRKSILEIFNADHADHEHMPCKCVNLENVTVINPDKEKRGNNLVIRLRDNEGAVTQLLPPSPASHKKWMSELKSTEKR